MAKGKDKNFNNNKNKKNHQNKQPVLTSRLKKWIVSLAFVLLSLVVIFSFFHRAGSGGDIIFRALHFLVGKTVFFIPLLFLLTAILLWKPSSKLFFLPGTIVLILFLAGIAGILAVYNLGEKNGGWLGYILAWPVCRYFGIVVSYIVFCSFIATAIFIVWEVLIHSAKKKEQTNEESKKEAKKQVLSSELERKDILEKPKFAIKPVEVVKANVVSESQKNKQKPIKEKPAASKKEKAKGELVEDVGYKFPPLDLLDQSEEKPASGDIEYNAAVIKRTLQNFGIEVEMGEVHIGPTITQYTLKPAEGVKLSRITALNNDLALSLAAHPIRIEAPIPGKPLVGIEVPNTTRAKVKLGTVLASAQIQNSPAVLCLALGKDVMGAPIGVDLADMPHLLVAGATGAGKTICLNSLIMSLIFRHSPQNLRFILIDPKRVEFSIYSSLPHLLTPIILNAKKAVNVLNWLVGEMERRFEVLRAVGSRDILAYHKLRSRYLAKSSSKTKDAPDSHYEPMPFIVLVIDELADLMVAKGREVETAIVRLSQLARAVGIHLIVATQRPSVEVITGLIKANITARIAFQVASQIDSRTILDTSGAEKLLGKGDMLYVSAEFSRPKRIQGSFVSSAEIKKVVEYLAKENIPQPMQQIEDENGLSQEGDLNGGMSDKGILNGEDIVNFTAKDPLYEEAKEIVIQYRRASASLLQRRLQIGYARAARILDMLEQEGVVGQAEGAKPREVLIGNKDKADNEDDGYKDVNDLEFE